MLSRTRLAAAALAALALPTLATAATAPRETVRPAFRHEIPSIPGKSLVSVVVSYPPGARSRAHRHAASAFVYAFVLSGAIRSRVDDGPAQALRIARTGVSARARTSRSSHR